MGLAFRVGAVFLALQGAVFVGAAAGAAYFGSCAWLAASLDCGAGVLGAAVLLFYGSAAPSFAALLWFFFRHQPRIPRVPNGKNLPSSLYGIWVALLGLQYVVPLGLKLGFDMDVPVAVLFPLMVCFVVASYPLARYRGRHPAVSLFGLIPIIGVFVVGVLLLKDRSTPSKMAGQESEPNQECKIIAG